MLKKIIFIIFSIWVISSSIVSFYSPDSSSTLGYIAMFLMLLIEAFGIGVFILRAQYFLKKKDSLLIFIWVLYVLLVVIANSSELKVDIREVLFWPSIYFLFYYFFSDDKNGVNYRFFTSAIVPLYISIVAIFFFSRFLGTNITLSGIQTASNLVFYVALMAPLLFLLDNNKKKLFLFFIGFLCLLLSLKRSALVFYSVVFFLYYYYNNIKGSISNIPRSILIFLFTIIIGYSFYSVIEQKSGDMISNRFSSISSDQGSGRFEIFELVLENYNSSKTIGQKILGSGHDAVRKDEIVLENNIPLSSHNDFLEVLYDYGLVGLILYFAILRRYIKNSLKIRKIDYQLFQSSLSTIIIVVIMSFASHLIIYPSYFSFIIIIWALVSVKLHNYARERRS